MALFPKSIVQFQSLSTTKEELHAFDVILGRGTGVAQHFGNANFRRLVTKHRPRYQKASKSEKMGISRAIVDEIARHGGQFLLPELVSGVKQEQQVRFWIVPHKQAVSKTSQALRELKKSTRYCQDSCGLAPDSTRTGPCHTQGTPPNCSDSCLRRSRHQGQKII